MATPPTTNQVFRVVGALEVLGIDSVASSSFSSQGIIKLVRSDGTTLGSIRGIADPSYRAFMVDATGVTAGFNVRTRISQGPTSIGGINDKYAISCISNITTMQYLNCIADATYNGTSQNFGTPLLVCDRYSTADSSNTGGSSPIARFVQAIHKEDENIVIHLGAKSKSIMGALGYNLFTDSASDRLWLGFTSASSQTAAPTKNILMDTAGNVTIPLQLTAGTIFATTYLNLPPVPSSQLLPLTLSTNKVGINKTTPTVALDVVGDSNVSGTLVAAVVQSPQVDSPAVNVSDAFVRAGNGHPDGVVTAPVGSVYMRKDGDVGTTLYTKATGTGNTGWQVVGLGATDILPITLDTVNNFVGINQTTPTQALDVTGNVTINGSETVLGSINATGTIVADGYIEGNGGLRNYSGGQNDIRGEVYLGGTVGDTLYIPAAGGAATINGDLTVQGDVSLTGANVLTADTVSATTYVGLPFPDLTPITLDVGNNRVGINNNAPSHALTVQGSVAVSNDVASNTVNTEVLYATIGVVTQGVDVNTNIILEANGNASIAGTTTTNLSGCYLTCR